jgi:hypothetical protein
LIGYRRYNPDQYQESPMNNTYVFTPLYASQQRAY